MRVQSNRARLLATTIICGAAAIGAPAFAQDTGSGAVQEVVVTGSLIRGPNITSDSPLASVSKAEVNLEGTTTVENLVNNLPQAIGGQNLGQSIDSTGTSSVSLRGLGAQRTLVLVDGRRMNPGDPTQQAPGGDLNMIPAQLVERVDVVTGGASATYGADAVAGVVNFIMRKNFEGLEVDGQVSGNQNDAHSKSFDSLLTSEGYKVPGNSTFDGQQYTASFIAGSNLSDGRGNITVYGSYFHSDPVLQPTRDFGSCALGSTASVDPAVYDSYFCVGSSSSAYGRFTPGLSPTATGGSTEYHDNTNGTNTFVSTSVPGYNFNGLSYLQREDDRYSLGYFAHYDINKQVQLYSDFMFLRDETDAQFGPTGLFAGTTNVPRVATWQVSCANPLLSAQQEAALCAAGNLLTTNPAIQGPNQEVANVEIGYRLISNGPRTGVFTHDNFRIVVGSRGDLSDAWSYDAYASYGHTDYQQILGHYASLNAIANSLLVNPNGTCVSGGSCVPLNIFQANSTGITKAQLNYIAVNGEQDGTVTEQVAQATLNGDLGKYNIRSPFAKDGVEIAVGADYRRDNLTFTPDYEDQIGDLAGGSIITATQGSYDVYELFAEAHVPIVQGLPFVKSINFNPGYRYSDYSSIGTTDTYKLDADWAVSNDVRFRYSYNVAVRAPNITELYTPNAELLFTGVDPCAGPHATATGVPVGCSVQGVTLREYTNGISDCPASQCSDIAGGSPTLRPETAYTDTYGAVFSPQFVPRLVFTVDYYNIRINNVISEGVGGPSAEETGCFNTQSPILCNLIHRDPATGELYGAGYVEATDVNEGFIQTKGVDFTAAYSYPLGAFGRVSASFDGTYVQHFVTEPYGATAGGAGSGTYDCAGLYGATCGVPTPHFRAKTRLTWSSPFGLSVSGQWRFVGGTKVDGNENNPLDAFGYITTDSIDARIPDVSYFDLTMQYKFKDKYTLRAGCNNILDRSPPFGDANNTGVYGQGNGNTFPQLYDTLGRNIFVGVTADF